MFGTRFRYSGAGVAYQLASTIGGGFTPLIAASLVEAADDKWTYVAIFVTVASVISVLAGLAAPKASTFQDFDGYAAIPKPSIQAPGR